MPKYTLSKKHKNTQVDLPIQMFGTVESDGEQLKALFCRDLDLPDQAMIQWPATQTQGAGGVLLRLTFTGTNRIHLTPLQFYKADDGGGLYAPSAIDNPAQLFAITAELTLSKKGLHGVWNAPNGEVGRIAFTINSRLPKIKARKLKGWSEFKTWASTQRENGNFIDFRGHGCNSFKLSSTLHRIGRARSERFCYETMVQFQALAESVLDIRFDRRNPDDFSTALGLAQHHGLPTPLLDWSASPYVAAFFAFSDAMENKSARPKSTHVRIYALSKQVARMAGRSVSLTTPGPYATYFSIAPWKNPRLLAQQGRFLLSNVVDLEGFLCDAQKTIRMDLVTAVDVPISCAVEALEDLQFMGLSASTMFPGLDGICRMMKHQMAFKK